MKDINQNRLLAIISRVETDIARLSAAVESAQRTLKSIKTELHENGKKVVELQAGQRLLAGRFKQRDGTVYGIGRQMAPKEADE
jgi:phage shock protein A